MSVLVVWSWYIIVADGPCDGSVLDGSPSTGGAVVGDVTNGGTSLLGTAGGIALIPCCAVLVFDTDDVVAARKAK